MYKSIALYDQASHLCVPLQALRFACSVPASLCLCFFPSFGYWDEGNLVVENESPRTVSSCLFSLYCFIVIVIYSFVCAQGLRYQVVGSFGVERHFGGERNSTEGRGGEGILEKKEYSSLISFHLCKILNLWLVSPQPPSHLT